MDTHQSQTLEPYKIGFTPKFVPWKTISSIENFNLTKKINNNLTLTLTL